MRRLPTYFLSVAGILGLLILCSVAIYQDRVPMNSPALQLGQLFDLAGVEVLRGPQGAGAGRNASAGAIKVTSRMPVSETGGFLSASYGNYDALDLEGALEVPIIEDTLATRISFRVNQRDGWGENGCAGLPSLGAVAMGVMLALLWQFDALIANLACKVLRSGEQVLCLAPLEPHAGARARSLWLYGRLRTARAVLTVMALAVLAVSLLSCALTLRSAVESATQRRNAMISPMIPSAMMQ